MQNKKKIIVFENQRYIPFFGWSEKNLLIYERKSLTDQDGAILPKELEKTVMEHVSKKNYEIFKSEVTDKDGYLYGFRWNWEFTKVMSKSSFVRKRCLLFPKIDNEVLGKKRDAEKHFSNSKNGPQQTQALEYIFNPDSDTIPLIIADTILFIEKNGLNVEGIFRLSGDSNAISNLNGKYENGEFVDLNNEDIHTITGTLKLYLRNFKDPLLNFGLYDSLIQAYEKEEEYRIACISQLLLELLPPGNRAVLKELLSLCFKIEQNKSKNKMEAHNLSIVFAPNILRKKDESPLDMIDNMNKHQNVVEFLILNYESIYETTHSKKVLKNINNNKEWRNSLSRATTLLTIEMSPGEGPTESIAETKKRSHSALPKNLLMSPKETKKK
eukprot:TRINITY_DN12592_c0_g1_i1.p1 TRINITY_DN12592_c0_g1~~TRINITY_DN12592_c0_g1_i1.p1  ORF type:complete len:384 (-),score=134.33 TRINITY_DN12592_c0_g1_i1:1-1152(-)